MSENERGQITISLSINQLHKIAIVEQAQRHDTATSRFLQQHDNGGSLDI